jgi:hypothetical protein
MRLFGFLGLVITLAVGMYIYSLQVKAIDSTSGSSAMATDAPLIAGVKNDLIAIGSAERGHLASQGRYASLDELISGNYITISRARPPYVYDVEVSAGNFRATASRTTKGSPSQLSITDDMLVQTTN